MLFPMKKVWILVLEGGVATVTFNPTEGGMVYVSVDHSEGGVAYMTVSLNQ